ncbi:MAG: MFS transporter [Firmicutes bacterium]|nr:MFS transporter [Bacillota bacterium]
MNGSEAAETVPLKMKLGYGLGDFGANLLFQCVGFYLLFYFTDVLFIGAGLAGTIIMVAKIWDAVTDPLMGNISDRTRTRWGSKRVYLLLGALPLALSFYLLFYGPDLTGSSLNLYALVTFVLFCTFYTVVNIPYGALTSALTLDAKERASITGYRMSFAILGTLVVAGVTLVLVALFKTQQEGFRFVGALYGIAAALFTLIAFLTTREKKDYGEKKSASFREEISYVFRNTPFLSLTLATLLQYVALGMTAAMVTFFFKYPLAMEKFTPIAFALLFVTAVLFMPFWVYMSRRLGKRPVFIAGMIIFGGALLLMYFATVYGMAAIITLLVIAGVGLSTVYLSPWSMIPDTVEYSEWKFGARREGTIYGFFYFAHKVAAAMAGFICGQGLSLAGYVPDVVQTPMAEEGIKILMTIFPAGVILLGIIVISFYPISGEMHSGMVAEIAKRHAKAG